MQRISSSLEVKTHDVHLDLVMNLYIDECSDEEIHWCDHNNITQPMPLYRTQVIKFILRIMIVSSIQCYILKLYRKELKALLIL